ncbi:hypothetical protein NMR87_004494 [Vibrio alginolyticus]|nr:hypothetical protein [Vibrio alginolyticus]
MKDRALSKNTLCYAYVRDEVHVEIAEVDSDGGNIKILDSLPKYESLLSTFNALNKVNKRIETTSRHVNKAKRLSSVVAGTASALTIGMIASMFINLFLDEAKTFTKSELTNIVIELREELEVQDNRIQVISKSLDDVNKKIISLSSIPDSSGWKIEASSLSADSEVLKAKLQALENALTVNPEKALAVPILRKDLDNIEKGLRSELQQTRLEINRMYDQNKWFIGLMLTMAVSVLGIAISSFFNRSDT